MQLSVKTSPRWLASLAVSAVGVFDGFSCECWVKGNIPYVKLKAEKNIWILKQVILPRCKAFDDNLIDQSILRIRCDKYDMYLTIFTTESFEYLKKTSKIYNKECFIQMQFFLTK